MQPTKCSRTTQSISIDRLKDRVVGKGRGRHSTLRRQQRPVFSQTNNGSVSRATSGTLLKGGVDRMQVFLSRTEQSSHETDPETVSVLVLSSEEWCSAVQVDSKLYDLRLSARIMATNGGKLFCCFSSVPFCCKRCMSV